MTDQPSAFVVSLPKSGTNFTWNTLVDIAGLRYPEVMTDESRHAEIFSGRNFTVDGLYGCNEFYTQALIPDQMTRYVGGGYVYGAHMPASRHNTFVLEQLNIPVSVLLRDPRDATISWTYHFNKVGPSTRAFHSNIYFVPPDYETWPFAEQLSYQVRSYLPLALNWIEGWLGYYADARRGTAMNPLFFDEIKRHPRRYFERIARFHGLAAVDFDRIPAPKEGANHFRKGEHDQWVYEFSDQDKAFTDLLIGDRLEQAYERAAVAHGGVAKARHFFAKGFGREALGALLSAMDVFSRSSSLHAMFIEALAAAGGATADAPPTPATSRGVGLFLYDKDYIDRMAALVGTVKG